MLNQWAKSGIIMVFTSFFMIKKKILPSIFLQKYFWLLVAVVIAIPISQASAQTVTVLTDCQTLTQNGSYRLANNVSSSGTCFTIRGSGVTSLTLDGNGKTITVGDGNAVDIVDFGSGTPSHVTINNVTSSSDLRTYGDHVNHIIIQNSHLHGIAILGGDDVIIRQNVIGEDGVLLSNSDVAGWYPLRNQVINNTITGGSRNVKTLVELVGGRDHPCPRTDAVFSGNTITDTRDDNPPPEAIAAVRIRCATHTTFTNNRIHSTGTAIGLYLRDESDFGQYTGNVFWTRDHESLRIASGNLDKTFPSSNTFTNNVFRADTVSTMFLQGIGQHNVFRNNLWWGASDGLMVIIGSFANTWDHNTFYVTGSGPLTTLSYRDGPPADAWTNNIFDYSGSSLFGYDGWASGRYGGNYNLFYNRAGQAGFGSIASDLAAWRTATGADRNSRESNPLFLNPAAGDFRLASGSPARGHASDGSDIGFRAAVTPVPGSNPPPQVSFANLRNLQVVTGRYLMVMSARDADGIAQLTFSLDGKQFSKDTSTPYRTYLDTTRLWNGRHTLSVTATDRRGAQTTIRRTFVARNRLAVILGATLVSGHLRGNVSLQLARQIGGAPIRSAAFSVDGVLIRRLTAAPWKVAWDSTTIKNGRHRFSLLVTDTAGTKAASSTLLLVAN